MRKLRAFFVRLIHPLRRRPVDDDFAAELKSHLDMHIEDGMRDGLSEEEARRQALIKLGGAEQTRQAYRERSALPGLEILVQDARYALRGFGSNPVFTLTAIVTLTLGIGATTAVFSVVDRILFRSLPYTHADRLVSVGLTAPIIPQEFMLGGSYYDWRDHQKPFESLTSETGVNACDLTERNPAPLSCASVEQNFLPTFGISPVLGRNFLPEEDRPHGPKVGLISYALWASHYGRDPAVLNRLIDIDGQQIRIIGVLPSDFEMPALEQADVVVPQALDEAAERKADPGRVLYAFARLKPGVSTTQAIAQLQPVFNYSLSLAPPRFRSEVHLRVRSVRDRQMQDARLVAWILLGAVLAVLLISCANVASLLLTRATTRERELAVRSALGASQRRLVRQALTESLLLAFFGAAAGCVLAEGLLRLFIAIAPSSLPFLGKAQLDARIIFFTVCLALVSGVIFGLIPALHKPRSIALAARAPITGTRALLLKLGVVAQIAVTIVLLAGAALLVRSFSTLQAQPLGMRTRSVLTAAISLNRYRYTTPEAQMQFFSDAESALRRLPGISVVGLSDSIPPGGPHHDQIFSIMAVAGAPPLTGGTGGMVAWRWITPGYFNALDVPIIRGRAFTEDQRTSKELGIIISNALGSRLFPQQNPIGQHVQLVPNGPWFTVQGVAADVKNGGLNGADEPEYYRLRRNMAEDWQSFPSAVFIVKTELAPQAVAPWVQSQIAAIDPTVPVEIASLRERVGKLADRQRFETALLGLFALSGLLMAVIGLYGVIAYMTVQRTQEIGVRMALGAARIDILRLILGQGLRLVALGSAIGLVAALFVSRILKSLLYSVGTHDPASFIGVSLLMFLSRSRPSSFLPAPP